MEACVWKSTLSHIRSDPTLYCPSDTVFSHPAPPPGSCLVAWIHKWERKVGIGMGSKGAAVVDRCQPVAGFLFEASGVAKKRMVRRGPRTWVLPSAGTWTRVLASNMLLHFHVDRTTRDATTALVLEGTTPRTSPCRNIIPYESMFGCTTVRILAFASWDVFRPT